MKFFCLNFLVCCSRFWKQVPPDTRFLWTNQACPMASDPLHRGHKSSLYLLTGRSAAVSQQPLGNRPINKSSISLKIKLMRGKTLNTERISLLREGLWLVFLRKVPDAAVVEAAQRKWSSWMLTCLAATLGEDLELMNLQPSFSPKITENLGMWSTLITSFHSVKGGISLLSFPQELLKDASVMVSSPEPIQDGTNKTRREEHHHAG